MSCRRWSPIFRAINSPCRDAFPGVPPPQVLLGTAPITQDCALDNLRSDRDTGSARGMLQLETALAAQPKQLSVGFQGWLQYRSISVFETRVIDQQCRSSASCLTLCCALLRLLVSAKFDTMLRCCIVRLASRFAQSTKHDMSLQSACAERFQHHEGTPAVEAGAGDRAS